MATPRNDQNRDSNPDPITGAPGSHPVGTGVGAAGGGVAGAAAGAAIGSVVPGIGTAIGGAIGAAVGATGGGLAGKSVAERIDPTAEDAYWRENYKTRSYIDKGSDYSSYQPAYRYGWEMRSRYAGKSFDEVEPQLRRDWTSVRGQSNLDWDRAKLAARDAWARIDQGSTGQMRQAE